MLSGLAKITLFVVGIILIALGAAIIIGLASFDWVYLFMEAVAAGLVYAGLKVIASSKNVR